jgi:tetratricopeptide (TPR) repeat protein
MNAAPLIQDRDAFLQSARDLRAARRAPEALAVLDRLQALYPRFSRLYHERGHCLVLMADAPGAIAALSEAVRLNPTFPASWDMLEQLYRMAGDAEHAAEAARRLTLLKQLPPKVVMASSLLADGDLDLAVDVIRDYLKTDRNNVGALRLLARICIEGGALQEAEVLLHSVLARSPDYHEARLDYAVVLLQQQKHQRARLEAEQLLRHDTDNRDYLKQYAAASVGLGDYEAVVEPYDRLLAAPGQSAAELADLQLWRGNALKVTGRRDEAIGAYRASIEARPDNGVAWFSLANLKTYRFTEAQMAQMQGIEAQPGLAQMDRIYLCFALGKALEDQADFEASWRWYERGNAQRSTTSKDDPGMADAVVRQLRRVFTPEVFARRAGWGVDDRAPIFVLGLPRSGSTLIEQILASHSKVEGTQELTEIDRYVGELCGRNTDGRLPLHPEAMLHLSAADAKALGERFLNETRIYRRQGRPLFIDKMPNNFWHIGLIQLILPGAKIIDIRRDPMSCGFSNLKQLFGGANQDFTYGARTMARRYRAYLDLMEHWDAVLPGRVLRVHYEDVVEDLETSVRRILAHCDLPFEPACVEFHQTRRSVRTPSSEQVRQPIGRSGLDQWRHYSPWLGPLKAALGDALTRYRT